MEFLLIVIMRILYMLVRQNADRRGTRGGGARGKREELRRRRARRGEEKHSPQKENGNIVSALRRSTPQLHTQNCLFIQDDSNHSLPRNLYP